MHLDAIVAANIVIGTLFTTAIGFAVAWVRARERATRAEMARRMLPTAAEEQLAQLQRATEAIALELERIGEAQRFTARLLSERAPGASPVLPSSATQRAPGTITPH